jgi:acyl carrier protein
MIDIARDLRPVFTETLGVPAEAVVDELRYNSLPEWDSVAHMALVAAIEKRFDIMLETGEVLEMSTFAKARQIVARHLG